MRAIAKYPVDFHMHSIRSDGELSPEMLVKRAAARSLKVISLTDHDTVAGIDEALDTASAYDLDVVPGIELSAWLDREIHILGFFIDHSCPTLKAKLATLSERRKDRLRLICERLATLGCPLMRKRF